MPPPEYVASIRSLTEPTWLDGDTIASGTTYEASLPRSWNLDRGRRAWCVRALRPPGHHARRARRWGSASSTTLRSPPATPRQLGLERVAIVDWDVHHGNGTEEIFRDDPTVFFASLHQWPFYPGTGGPDDQGETTLNVPLAAGCGDEEYERAFDQIVEPAVRAFEPELVIVSSGFDAHTEDPLASMNVTEDGFRELARRSAALAPRAAAVLEGGYNLSTLPRLVNAALEGFA